MARPSEGWKLRERRGIQHVRFTHAGKAYELSTGERDPAVAAREAERIYVETVSGRRRPGASVDSRTPLVELVAGWGADLEADHAERTAREYLIVARAHWIPRWKSLAEMATTESAKDYTRDALRRVQRASVRKELSAMRGFFAWCVEHKALSDAPLVPEPPPKSTGVRATTRKPAPVKLTPAEVEKIIDELGGEKITSRAHGLPVHDWVVVLWDTWLRPSTVARLSSPEHFTRGKRELRIAREIDKGRFDRVIDLTPRAYAALMRHSKEPGLIFGQMNPRESIRLAAIRALGKVRGERVTKGDLRHSGITAGAGVSTNMAGLQWKAGHKYASTTARYVHPGREAAREVDRALRGNVARRRG